MNRKRSFQELDLAEDGLHCESLHEQEIHHTNRSCIQCGATQTPQWRQGPAGPQTLCNACGVRYSRLTKKTRPKKTREPQMVDQGADEQSGHGNVEESRAVLVTPFAEAAQYAPGPEHPTTDCASQWGVSTPRRTITTSGQRHNTTDGSQQLTHAHRQVEGAASPSSWQAQPINYVMIHPRAATPPPRLSRLGSRKQSSTLPSNVAVVELTGALTNTPLSLPASRRGSSAQDLLNVIPSDLDLSNTVPVTKAMAAATSMAVTDSQPEVKDVDQDDELDCAAALSLLSMASTLPPVKDANLSPETTAVAGNEQIGDSSAGSAAIGGSPGASTTGNEQPCSPGVISNIRDDLRAQVPLQDLGLLHQLCERFDQSIRAMVAANAACSAVFQVLRHKQQEARAAQSAARLAANQLMKYASHLGCTVHTTTRESKPDTLELDNNMQTSKQAIEIVTQEVAVAQSDSKTGMHEGLLDTNAAVQAVIQSAALLSEVAGHTTVMDGETAAPKPAESASGDALEAAETDKLVCHVRQPSSQSNFTLVAVDNLQ